MRARVGGCCYSTLTALVRSSVLCLSLHSSSSLVVGHEGRGHLQGVSLLLLNTVLAFLGAAAGFGVSHAEHIVCLDAAVHSTVARDGLAELQARLLSLNSVEHTGGTFKVLAVVLALARGGPASKRVLNGRRFYSEESVHGSWRDRLLQKR